MRNELENIELIEKYLRGELSTEERASFEEQLKTDANLQKEVELQKDVVKGIERFGVKKSISKAARKYRTFKTIKYVSIGTVLIIVSVVTYFYLNQTNFSDDNPEINKIETPLPFIHPAFNNVNIPFDEFTFLAETGDTIFYETGSILYFPPNAFVDNNGNLVTGEIKIMYRELADPIDFFLSGIPMDYDSNGTKYTFESAGMCEVYGFQKNEPIFINTDNKPEINLTSKTTDNAHNLYYLDTIQQKWIGKGKDVITVIDENQISEKSADFTRVESSKFDMPIPTFLLEKPNKASGKYPTFSIFIEPGSVPELQAYNHLLFEVDKDEKNYDASQSKTEWGDVIVEKSTIKGKYLVTFIKGNKKLIYLTRPVFEGKNYDEALLLFENKKKEYNNLLTKRLGKEKKQKEMAKSRDKENEETSRLNILIEARNKKIDKANSEISDELIAYKRAQEKKSRIKQLVIYLESNNPKANLFSERDIQEAMKIIEIRRLKNEERLKQKDLLKKQRAEYDRKLELLETEREKLAFEEGGQEMEYQVIRTFYLEGFGTWNCDNPIIAQGRPLVVDFKDNKNNTFMLDNITIVIKEFNGVFKFNNKFTSIRVFESDMMLWTVQDNKFVYLTYGDYNKCNITLQTKEYTFKMNVYPDKIKTKEDIKKILGL